MTRAQATRMLAGLSEAPSEAPSEALATVELDEFWCSDCLSRALFERLAADGDASEWACTACGAAYFDAIDLVAGVSEPSSGRASA